MSPHPDLFEKSFELIPVFTDIAVRIYPVVGRVTILENVLTQRNKIGKLLFYLLDEFAVFACKFSRFLLIRNATIAQHHRQ
jgi:hypothetical protein